MRIDVDGNGHIVLKEVYSGVMLETEEGNKIGICMRDDTFEINVLPRGFKNHCWQRVDMQTKSITKMNTSEADSDNLTEGEGDNQKEVRPSWKISKSKK